MECVPFFLLLPKTDVGHVGQPVWGMSVHRRGARRLRGYFSSSDVEDLVIAL